MSTAYMGSDAVRCDGPLIPDFAWAGVVRMNPGNQEIHPGETRHCDGWCHGFGRDATDRRSYEHILPNISRGKLNYGCWFYTAPNASGWSGAYVNVGRSLRVGHCAAPPTLICPDMP